MFSNIHRSGVLTALFGLMHAWLVSREIAARSVYTIQPCTMSRHFMERPHTQGAFVFSCNLPLALLAE